MNPFDIAQATFVLSNPYADFESRQEEWKERIVQKFRDSRNLPRKKKKAIRKNLQLEWSIACWNPLQDLNIDVLYEMNKGE
jgi:uncharacterized membrane protein YbaN (DUF454 family)